MWGKKEKRQCLDSYPSAVRQSKEHPRVTIYLLFETGHIAKLQKNLRDFQKHLTVPKVSMNFLQ